MKKFWKKVSIKKISFNSFQIMLDEEFKKIVCAYEKLYEYLSSRKEVNGSEEEINSSYSKILEEIINEIINIIFSIYSPALVLSPFFSPVIFWFWIFK